MRSTVTDSECTQYILYSTRECFDSVTCCEHSEHHIVAQVLREHTIPSSPSNHAVVLPVSLYIFHTDLHILALTSFNNFFLCTTEKKHPAGRSHAMRSVAPWPPKHLSQVMSPTYSTFSRITMALTRSSGTGTLPNSSTTPTDSTRTLLKSMTSTSGATLLHHCKCSSEEQKQT